METVNGRPVDATVPAGNAADVAKVASSTDAVRAAYNAKVAIGAARDHGMTSIHEAQDGGAAVSSLDGMVNEATDGTTDIAAAGTVTTLALPPATLANGLPGATNFVPNNIDPNAATKTNARYYDITLDAAGTTTLDTKVTIDRFSVLNAQAKLNVTTAGSLTSLIGVNQYDGVVQVDGTINSGGDYFLLTGGLTGSGRINAPYLTSVRGMIAPGTTGTIGTLTVGGNVVLSSGSVLLVDVGPNGTSDRLAGVSTIFKGTTPVDGLVNVGGRVGFAPVAGYTIRSGDTYTIVTSQGGISGVFNPAVPLSAILTPQFVYSANAVQARIVAGLYRDVVANTPVQTAYARLLDQNRSNQDNLSALYGTLDLQNQATIRSTLEGLAPRTETLKYAIGTVVTDNAARFYRQHLSELDPSVPLSGTLTMIGKPQQFASLLATDLPGSAQTMTDASGSTVTDGVIAEGANVFIGGGYINGDSASMPTAVPFGGRDDFDGYYAVAGIDAQLDDHSVIGFGLNYTKVDGTTGGVAQQARGQLFQGTLYAKGVVSGFSLDAQASAGLYRAETRRNVSLAGTPYALRSQDNAFTFSGEIGLGKSYQFGTLNVGPRVAFRANRIEFTPTVETGAPGGPALRYDRQNLDSEQARAGLTLAGNGAFKPFASAYYVHDFVNRPGLFGANFVGGIGPSATFALASDDQNWGEAAVGVSYNTGAIELSVSANSTFERQDIKNQAYGGSVKIHF
ncbi:autotransporter outer membrane beta-barrel domain-containing protein [Sphingomonas oligophenolica]|uniref:Autotransporter outer membrane beta-barrel domain-containing protein n=1 Tax=Sphingomonas oligophenolica TaxID=301154 RepID=A0A502CNM4_9SPHN|nr:autotransporter outer membrane beta-barrel domain-containing protein [Sphingomonas oligophenolica]TPG13729.1 autotransporter outer membrane beta-barrel domain-containing protein [Sphingomonas oligophenolica]